MNSVAGVCLEPFELKNLHDRSTVCLTVGLLKSSALSGFSRPMLWGLMGDLCDAPTHH